MIKRKKLTWSFAVSMILAGCAAPAQPRSSAAPISAPAAAALPVKESPPPSAKSTAETAVHKHGAASAKPQKPAPMPEQNWKLKTGKLSGPGIPAGGKVISTFINPKNGAVSTDTCYTYGDFAVVESRTKGEIGAGEVTLRRKGAGNLCAVEYKGENVEIKIGEGYFAGVAGDYLLMDGAEAADGVLDFQLFAIETGKEVLKAQHHPDEEFTLTRKDGKTSLVYYARLPVKCELALEEQVCWKKVLEANQIKKPLPMPDCTAAFKKTGTSSFESALVTARVRIGDLKSPKPEFTGGRATCQPAL